jgi:IstB-like ATP binding protein
MLTAPTLEKLHALKLTAMAAAWTEHQHHADMTALAFDERFGLLVEAEWLARENKRLARALRKPSSSSAAKAMLLDQQLPDRLALDAAGVQLQHLLAERLVPSPWGGLFTHSLPRRADPRLVSQTSPFGPKSDDLQGAIVKSGRIRGGRVSPFREATRAHTTMRSSPS